MATRVTHATAAPNRTIAVEQNQFLEDVLSNRNNRAIVERWDELALPDAWLVAGCLFQTVWNLKSGKAPESDIKDYDLFYFDAEKLDEDAERCVQARIDGLFSDLGVSVEASNQARVHLWYQSYFGKTYDALRSSTDGIDRFLVPAACVGIQPGRIYAPHGVQLLYDGILSVNPLTPHQELFDQKAASYRLRWPWLRIC